MNSMSRWALPWIEAAGLLLLGAAAVITPPVGGPRPDALAQAVAPRPVYLPWAAKVGEPHPEPVASAGGVTWAVAAAGDRAFFAVGLRLLEADLSDPAAPRVTATFELLDEAATGLALAGETLLVANGRAGLRLFDVATPGQLRPLAALAEVAPARRVSVFGATAYVSAGEGGVALVDVSAPARPRRLGAYAAAACAGDVLAWQGRALAACGAAGLLHLDTSDPARPVLLGATGEGDDLRELARVDRYVVATGFEDLVVLELPAAGPPTELTRMAAGLDGDADLAAYGPMVYASGDDLLAVFDLTDPTRPRALLPVELDDYELVPLAVAGDRLLAGDDYFGVLRVFDLARPARPVATGQALADDVGEVFRLAASPDILYVWATDMILMDGGRLPPDRLGLLAEPPVAGVIAARGNVAYLGADGFSVLDASDPSQPVRTRPTEDSWLWHGLTFGGDLLVALGAERPAEGADWDAKVVIWDAIDPARPRPVGIGESYRQPEAAAASPDGRWAYVGEADHRLACTDAGCTDEASHALEVFDLADPAAPASVHHVDLPEGYAPAAVVDGRLLALGEAAGLVVLDLADPARPREIARLDLGCTAARLLPYGRYAFVGCPEGVLWVDLADPAAPRRLGFTATAQPAYELALAGRYLWVGQGRAGMLALRLHP